MAALAAASCAVESDVCFLEGPLPLFLFASCDLKCLYIYGADLFAKADGQVSALVGRAFRILFIVQLLPRVAWSPLFACLWLYVFCGAH
jgi:hypothetical protein